MTVKDFCEKVDKSSFVYIRDEDHTERFDGGKKIPEEIGKLEVCEIQAESTGIFGVTTRKAG